MFCPTSRALASMIVCLEIGFVSPALADTIFVGGNPFYQQSTILMPDGEENAIIRIGSYFHQMDLAPHSAQPIGLGRIFNVLRDPGSWYAARCEQWVQKVHDDEAAWTSASKTYPYLVIDIAADAQPVTINGVSAYGAKDVLCWEAFDFGPPLY